MTGFVSHECDIGDYYIIWEVKTLNHRFFDMSLKLPESLRCIEFDLRNIAKQHVRRGKMDVSLFIKNKNLKDSLRMSDQRLDEIIDVFDNARNKFLAKGFGALNLHLNLDQLYTNSCFTGTDSRSLCENMRNDIIASFQQVIIELNQTRADEGKRLCEALENCLCTIKQITTEIAQYAKQTKDQTYKKLLARVNEISSNVKVDNIRLEQEILLIAQKADIQEELDRLNSHYCEICALLRSGSVVGRKLDFLMQELNRESNTICSKATDINIINSAVNLKTYIEQMREQIQNIE